MQQKGNWKPYNVKYITNNIKKVFGTDEIDFLSKASYTFLYLMDGFIAHYDINGFKCYYRDVISLAKELADERHLFDADRDETKEYFRNSYGAAYNTSKADIKRNLVRLARKYIKDKEEKRLWVATNTYYI